MIHSRFHKAISIVIALGLLLSLWPPPVWAMITGHKNPHTPLPIPLNDSVNISNEGMDNLLSLLPEETRPEMAYLNELGAPLLRPVFQTEPLHVNYCPKFSPDTILRHTIPGMKTYQIQEGTALYYLTFTVIEWLPVFVTEAACKIVADSLNYCHQHKALRINAFVIMPTHLHLILFDADFDHERLRITLRDMRQYTGRQLADYCQKFLPPPFFQVMKGTRRTDRARQFWQQSKHAVAIWTEDFWQAKVRYIHENLLRKGLVRGERRGGFRRRGIGC